MELSLPTGLGGTPEFAVGKGGEVKPISVYEAEQLPMGQRFPATMITDQDEKMEQYAKVETSVSFGRPGEDDEDGDEEDGQEEDEVEGGGRGGDADEL